MNDTHYQPKENREGLWGFTTPTGTVDGILGEERARKIAESEREQDLDEAQHGFGPIAEVKRKYFLKQYEQQQHSNDGHPAGA